MFVFRNSEWLWLRESAGKDEGGWEGWWRGMVNEFEGVQNLGERDVELHEGIGFCLCGGGGVDGSEWEKWCWWQWWKWCV